MDPAAVNDTGRVNIECRINNKPAGTFYISM